MFFHQVARLRIFSRRKSSAFSPALDENPMDNKHSKEFSFFFTSNCLMALSLSSINSTEISSSACTWRPPAVLQNHKKWQKDLHMQNINVWMSCLYKESSRSETERKSPFLSSSIFMAGCQHCNTDQVKGEWDWMESSEGWSSQLWIMQFIQTDRHSGDSLEFSW